jgi:RNA polymerase sigma factor (sigma-70 family)
VNPDDTLSERFEQSRAHLHAVAYRLLGSASEAEDAVQETWLRLRRTDTSGVDNLQGWLTTVVGRVCLDLLRARARHRAVPLDPTDPDPAAAMATGPARVPDPEAEALLAESVGRALVVVLESLTPAERIAFVLHDIFAISFDEIAPIVDRNPVAVRQLASRARRRVQADPASPYPDMPGQRRIVDAFFAAAREGRFDDLLTLLDPDVVFRADAAAAAMGTKSETRGSTAVARFFSNRAHGVALVTIDGGVGGFVIPREGARLALSFTIVGERIVAVEAVANPEDLAAMSIENLDGAT